MRIHCPYCGSRDRREFTVKGEVRARPEGSDWSPEWDAYLHLRANPAGETREYWHHGAGCGAWLVVRRDTVSHAILGVDAAGEGQG